MPRRRDNEFVKNAVRYAAMIKRPFLGHKCAPQVSLWPGFNVWRYSPTELMHGK